jgi:hypothetical protein
MSILASPSNAHEGGSPPCHLEEDVLRRDFGLWDGWHLYLAACCSLRGNFCSHLRLFLLQFAWLASIAARPCAGAAHDLRKPSPDALALLHETGGTLQSCSDPITQNHKADDCHDIHSAAIWIMLLMALLQVALRCSILHSQMESCTGRKPFERVSRLPARRLVCRELKPRRRGASRRQRFVPGKRRNAIQATLPSRISRILGGWNELAEAVGQTIVLTTGKL